MTYHIAICDDDEAQLESLHTQISSWSRHSGYPCEIHCFPSAEAFLFAYEDDKTCDILLLDIEMNGISGISLAKRIRRERHRTEIIFITSHFEFISEGYEVDALHYLTKPVPEEKLAAVLDRAAERLGQEPSYVIIACEGETVKLYEKDILYVESFLHYISIHTTKKEYRIKENISGFEEKLSADFFRIHRSYLVSLKYIIRISRSVVTLAGNVELPLARGKYDEINRAFIAQN
ncbi:MAG TPA: DNA-binding response regulator [Lachnospiraceae bacterium]|nr:DNA-binding response regulator [Lachnospiraceae bacterium]